MYQAWFTGTGAALPEKVLTNFDLEKLVDTSDEWITQRTGIRQRRVLREGETTSDLAIRAARQALDDAGIAPEKIGAVIVATLTPDTVCPALAAVAQHGLGAANACAFDINAACTGFVYGTALATSMVQTGLVEHVLLIGAEGLSRVIDFQDRNSCILFGDGAGAAVISRADAGAASRVIDSVLKADGSASDLIEIPAGGAKLPATRETVEGRQHFLRLKGKEVFKFATKAMVELVEEALSRNGLEISDLDLVVPHQVNYRIIEAALKKLELPEERVYLNLDRYGNTSAASVPIALAEAAREHRLRRGSLLLCVAFGAGMTWGYNLIRW
jgi:3-oxoacyl-[acyl-carrier-protein] synthase-3